jgi:hypothetical protein
MLDGLGDLMLGINWLPGTRDPLRNEPEFSDIIILIKETYGNHSFGSPNTFMENPERWIACMALSRR